MGDIEGWPELEVKLNRQEVKRQAAIRAADQEVQRLRELILQAIDLGVPKTRIAEAAGISRENLYRIAGLVRKP